MNTILGKQNLTPFKRKSMLIDLAWGKMASDSVIVNKAHNELKSMLESGVIKVSPEWNGWINLDLNNRTHDDKRKFLNENGHSMNVRDRIMAEMDIAVEQLLNVDIVRDSDKMAKTDKFGMFKFKSSGKKDSAYSLLYASAMFSVLRELKRKGMSMIVEEFSGSSQNNFSPAAGIISELGDEREARSMRGVKKEGIE